MGSGQVDPDVIVVGAGPAGSAAAIACAQRGLRVVLLERQAGCGERPGETLHPGIEPLLAQLGIGERLAEVVGARHRGIWISWGGPARFEAFGSDGAGAWSGFQVCRGAFDELLIGRAKEIGVVVRRPVAVTDPIVEAGTVCGVVADGGVARAPIVVDASGAARWLPRKLGLKSIAGSPRLLARYGYAEGSCPPRDDAPALVGDASGWTWTAKVWPDTYQWTRLTFDEKRPPGGWMPAELSGLKPRGRMRGADVTWRLTGEAAGPGWYIVGDAAATLDPTSSHGVLKAILSGIAAGHLIAGVLDGKAPACGAATAYHQWLAQSFDVDCAKLADFYRALGTQGFEPAAAKRAIAGSG